MDNGMTAFLPISADLTLFVLKLSAVIVPRCLNLVVTLSNFIVNLFCWSRTNFQLRLMIQHTFQVTRVLYLIPNCKLGKKAGSDRKCHVQNTYP